MLSILSYVSGPLICPPWRNVCQVLEPFFNWIDFLPGVELYEFFIYFGGQTLVQVFGKYFPIQLVPFSFCCCFLWPCRFLFWWNPICLFLGFLFCSIDLYVCYYASTILFWLPWSCSIVRYKVLWSFLLFFFFLKIAEAIQSLFWFHINFWNICSISVKYVNGILIGIVLNL